MSGNAEGLKPFAVPAEREAPDAYWWYFYSWTRRCRPGISGPRCYNSVRGSRGEFFEHNALDQSRRLEPRHACRRAEETSRATGGLDEGTFGVDAVRPSGGKSERKQKTAATELVRVVGRTPCCLAVVAFCRNICGQGPPFCRTTGASPVSTPSRLGEQRGASVA